MEQAQDIGNLIKLAATTAATLHVAMLLYWFSRRAADSL